MTFKECRKYGRELMETNDRRYGFMFRNKNGEWYFDFVNSNPNECKFCLEKNGVVDRVIDNHWIWNYQKRGLDLKQLRQENDREYGKLK